MKREIEQGLELKCPYCREPVAISDEEHEKNYMKRVKANDPAAMYQMGRIKYYDGGDYEGAFEYWTKAAALGCIEAHFSLSVMYSKGEGVEKNMKKEVYHLEEAAIGGHPWARINLGRFENKNMRMDRAMKHYIIAAKLGLDDGLEAVKKGFALGVVSKEDFEAALRGHQAAVDATKSEQREKAYAFYRRG
jgi:TPR repeat protein